MITMLGGLWAACFLLGLLVKLPGTGAAFGLDFPHSQQAPLGQAGTNQLILFRPKPAKTEAYTIPANCGSWHGPGLS